MCSIAVKFSIDFPIVYVMVIYHMVWGKTFQFRQTSFSVLYEVFQSVPLNINILNNRKY